jgi:protein-S-isoprenylcysteine O-methyltransferase Ste14
VKNIRRQKMKKDDISKRIIVFIYGVVSYFVFFVTFLYGAGFVGNFLVPKSIDSNPEAPLAQALLINTVLLGIFAVQHSIMARTGFKRILTGIIPKEAERSTYVLFSSLALILLFWLWQPIGGTIWNVDNEFVRFVLYSLFSFGWLTVLAVSFLINHFDLFGLRQVWLYLRGETYTQLKFRTPGPYKYVRHPLYVGWLLAFWATPTMTLAHLVFAVATTAYILIAIRYEERDLTAEHGRAYEQYRESVSMLIPFTRKTKNRTDEKTVDTIA